MLAGRVDGDDGHSFCTVGFCYSCVAFKAAFLPLEEGIRRFVGLLFGFFRYVRKEVRRMGNMVCKTNYLRSH
jgi:hypothetical protein